MKEGKPAAGRKLLAVLTVTLALAGCQELLVEPAPLGPAQLGLSFALLSAEGGGEVMEAGSAAAAFDRADGVRVILLREDESVMLDVSQDFAAAPETRVRVEVDVDGAQQRFLLLLELTFQGASLFQAIRPVALSAGETTEAEVVLEPVVAGVAVEESQVTLDTLGTGTQLVGAVVFATGDPIPELAPFWSTEDIDIVDVTPDGFVTARAVGEAQVVASYQGFSATVTVTVIGFGASTSIQ